MSGADAVTTKVSLAAKLVFILLAGTLSRFCAEVLSGSSVLCVEALAGLYRILPGHRAILASLSMRHAPESKIITGKPGKRIELIWTVLLTIA